MKESNQNFYIYQNLNSLHYYLYHLLETEMIFQIPIPHLKMVLYKVKDQNHIQKILYKFILRDKRNITLRILMIKMLIKNQEFKKAIKWAHKTLPYANPNEKKNLFYFLSKIFFILNRKERAIQYINLCLKIDSQYKPALKLKYLIHLDGTFS